MNRYDLILPDLHDDAYDRESYRDEHFAIFGHYPPLRPDEKCDHPMHAAIRRTMNDAKIEVPFDAEAVISVDSAFEQARQEHYDKVFDATRQFQQAVEEEDAHDA